MVRLNPAGCAMITEPKSGGWWSGEGHGDRALGRLAQLRHPLNHN
jgi:hypothetical protein